MVDVNNSEIVSWNHKQQGLSKEMLNINIGF